MNEIRPDIANPPDTSPLSSYSFQAAPITLLEPPDPPGKITIPIKGVKAGTYLILRLMAQKVHWKLTLP